MASLDHENIVKVYDICQDGEVPFIVVECVAGRDLGKLPRRHRTAGASNEPVRQEDGGAAPAGALLRPPARASSTGT